MKDEDFAFSIGALVGFSLGFFAGLLTGASVLGMVWGGLACCITVSLFAKYATRILARMMATAAAPRIEEINEPASLSGDAPEENTIESGDPAIAANA